MDYLKTLSQAEREEFGKQLFLLGGPGGAGKSTVMEMLMAHYGPLVQSLIRTTTRAPRAGEVNGVHYHFVDREAFLQMEREGHMAAVDIYNAEYYGVAWRNLVALVRASHKLIIGVGGICSVDIKTVFPEATLIYLTATMDELRQRLVKRGEKSHVTEQKMREAEQELVCEPGLFDYVIENHDPDLIRTVTEICRLIGLPKLTSIEGKQLPTIESVLVQRGIERTTERSRRRRVVVWGTTNGKVVKVTRDDHHDHRLGREANQPMSQTVAEITAQGMTTYYETLVSSGVRVVPEHEAVACLVDGLPAVCEIASDCGTRTLEDSVRTGAIAEAVGKMLEGIFRPLLDEHADFLKAGVYLKPAHCSGDGTLLDYLPGRVRLGGSNLLTFVEFPQPTNPATWRQKFYKYYTPTGVLRYMLVNVCRIDPRARDEAKAILYDFLIGIGRLDILSYFTNSPAELIGQQIRSGAAIDFDLLSTLGNKHPDEYPEVCLRDIAFELMTALQDRIADPLGLAAELSKPQDHAGIRQTLTGVFGLLGL